MTHGRVSHCVVATVCCLSITTCQDLKQACSCLSIDFQQYLAFSRARPVCTAFVNRVCVFVNRLLKNRTYGVIIVYNRLCGVMECFVFQAGMTQLPRGNSAPWRHQSTSSEQLLKPQAKQNSLNMSNLVFQQLSIISNSRSLVRSLARRCFDRLLRHGSVIDNGASIVGAKTLDCLLAPSRSLDG